MCIRDRRWRASVREPGRAARSARPRAGPKHLPHAQQGTRPSSNVVWRAVHLEGARVAPRLQPADVRRALQVEDRAVRWPRGVRRLLPLTARARRVPRRRAGDRWRAQPVARSRGGEGWRSSARRRTPRLCGDRLRVPGSALLSQMALQVATFHAVIVRLSVSLPGADSSLGAAEHSRSSRRSRTASTTASRASSRLGSWLMAPGTCGTRASPTPPQDPHRPR